MYAHYRVDMTGGFQVIISQHLKLIYRAADQTGDDKAELFFDLRDLFDDNATPYSYLVPGDALEALEHFGGTAAVHCLTHVNNTQARPSWRRRHRPVKFDMDLGRNITVASDAVKAHWLELMYSGQWYAGHEKRFLLSVPDAVVVKLFGSDGPTPKAA